MKHNLLNIIFWRKLRFIDPDLRGRRWRLRRFSNKAFGVSQICGIENTLTLGDGGGCETVMNHGGGEESEPGMAMFFVVPGEEALAKGTSILDGPKPFGEAGPVLESFEVALRVRVVVGDMRAAMGFGDPQVRHEKGRRPRLHGRPVVGMNRELARLDFLFGTGVPDQPRSQHGALTVRHHPAHHIAAEHIQNHIEVEVRPFRRTEQFCDVPAPEPVRSGSQQFRLLIDRMGHLIAALAGFPLALELAPPAAWPAGLRWKKSQNLFYDKKKREER